MTGALRNPLRSRHEGAVESSRSNSGLPGTLVGRGARHRSEPNGRRPGFWLKGNLVTTPVADWSFTDKVQNVKIQTNAWYLLLHSVTINCVSYRGAALPGFLLCGGLTNAHGRSWNENVARDPHVCMKMRNQLYDRTLALVTDPTEQEAVSEAKFKKYPAGSCRRDRQSFCLACW